MNASLAVEIIDVFGLWFASPAVHLGAGSLALVAMGFLDDFLGDDEGSEGDAGESGDGDDGDFFDDGGGGDGLGDLDDVDDGFDDEGFEDDGFDDMGGDGVDPELESRIEELEDEVATVSSTISTVRSENEDISETVEEVEENVRKLLDIYEMVTHGVNPFVDEAGGDAFDSDSFGIFEDPPDADDGEEDVDAELMNAEADSFFDDDFDGVEDDDFGGGEGIDAGDISDGEIGDAPDADDSDGADGDGGKTFDELKSEYESGDADWTDGPEGATSDGSEGDGSAAVGEFDGVEGDGSAAVEEFDGVEDDESDTAEATSGADPSASDVPDADDDGDSAPDPGMLDGEVDESKFEFPADEAEQSPDAYLAELPAGYRSELLVLEWMEYLRRHSDTAGTLRAIEYYRDLDWISPDVADELRSVVSGGHGQTVMATDGGSLSRLSIDHHARSLEYIARLGGDGIDTETVRNWSGW